MTARICVDSETNVGQARGESVEHENIGYSGYNEGVGRRAVVLFFFFQAEDGIRDYKVTGVQTCALPISRHRRARTGRAADAGAYRERVDATPGRGAGAGRHLSPGAALTPAPSPLAQIGRASCRERV